MASSIANSDRKADKPWGNRELQLLVASSGPDRRSGAISCLGADEFRKAVVVPEQCQVLRAEPDQVHDRPGVWKRPKYGLVRREVERLVSVEHDPDWYERIRIRIASAKLTNIDYRLVALDHPEPEPERARYAPLPQYVAVTDDSRDESFDFVLVDGHYRTHCIRRCMGKLRPKGLLMIDDVNLWPAREDIPVPADWPVVDLGSNGIKQTCIWRKP